MWGWIDPVANAPGLGVAPDAPGHIVRQVGRGACGRGLGRLSVLRRGSAAWRHLAWTVAVTGSLCLPLISASLPDWRVPLATSWPHLHEAVVPAETHEEQAGELPLMAQSAEGPPDASTRQPSFKVVSNVPSQPALERSEVPLTVRKLSAAWTKLWALGLWSIGSLLSGVPVMLGMLSLRKVARRVESGDRPSDAPAHPSAHRSDRPEAIGAARPQPSAGDPDDLGRPPSCHPLARRCGGLAGGTADDGTPARARPRQALGLPDATGRAGRVRRLLVQPAVVARPGPGSRRAGASLRRPGTGVRARSARVRRSPPGDRRRSSLRRAPPGRGGRDGGNIEAGASVARHPRHAAEPSRARPADHRSRHACHVGLSRAPGGAPPAGRGRVVAGAGRRRPGGGAPR